MAKLRKVNYVQGRATIVDAEDARVKKADGGEADGRRATTSSSRPARTRRRFRRCRSTRPRVLDSTGALDLPEIPKTLLVVGGGYIGLELGSVYAALGTKVSVVEMTPGLLPGADRDLVKILAQRVEKIFEQGHALDQGHRR